MRTLAAAAAVAVSVLGVRAHEFQPEHRKAAALVDRALSSLACPSVESAGSPWIEEDGPRPEGRVARHRSAALADVAITLLPVNGESWWIGASRRGREARVNDDPGCFVLGTAAFYVFGREDDPELDFERTVRGGREAGMAGRLIELRWYDETTGRKHRWFDARLAARLGWDRDGRGAPTEAPRPIPLPQAPNELF